MNFVILVFLCTLIAGGQCADQALEEEEVRAREYLNELNAELTRHATTSAEVSWAFESNITDHNEKVKNDFLAEEAKFMKEKAKEIRAFNFKAYQDDDLHRQFSFLGKLGYSALPDERYAELLSALTDMTSNYAKVRVCSFDNRTKCDMQLEPEITAVFEESRNPEELQYYWEQWYNKAGTPVKGRFLKYLTLNKEAAVANNFTNGADVWLDAYEDPSFEQQLDDVFDQMRPLYQQLHAYVRQKLRVQYGDLVPEKGSIPMHLLGNMWAQEWSNIAGLTRPFPDEPEVDVTDEMVKQGYTPIKMFEMGDDFFQSLNMTKLPKTFWEKSILEKPKDGRELVCHASAWDFYVKDDVRIKQCTRVTMEQLFTVHHELGHIQYFLQYQDQPYKYRDGANPGFHEAVGDTIALSVASAKHLKKIGLIKTDKLNKEQHINKLYSDALDKIIFLPFAFVIDKYRWGVFRGDIKEDELNCRFWKMREEFSGVVPPVPRTEDDFDPPAKYHVSNDVEYLRYLVSFIIQFQFHKAACVKANEYVPNDPEKILSNCDIYGSSNAGNALKDMLSKGLSQPWQDAMESLTGQRKVDASAILEYFRPLQEWLENYNKKAGSYIGWDRSFECPRTHQTDVKPQLDSSVKNNKQTNI